MNSKTVLGALGATAAAGLLFYFLARDKEEIVVKYDEKVHTREKLLEILHTFELDYAHLYLTWFEMIWSKAKELGKSKINEEAVDYFRHNINEITETIDEDIFKENKISKKFFEEWISKHKNDPEVKRIQDSLARNYEKVFKLEQLDIEFVYPKEITQQVYKQWLMHSYEKLRYDLFFIVRKQMNKTGSKQLTDEEISACIAECKLNDIKEIVYKKMKLPEVENETSINTMRKAFFMLAKTDLTWKSHITQFQNEHKVFLLEIARAVKQPNLDGDPLNKIGRAPIEEVKRREPKVVELGASTSTQSDVPKKATASFSFLGDESRQKDLISDFMNRNKKKVEEKKTEEVKEVKEVIPEEDKLEDKVEDNTDDVAADVEDNNDNSNGDEKQNSEHEGDNENQEEIEDQEVDEADESDEDKGEHKEGEGHDEKPEGE